MAVGEFLSMYMYTAHTNVVSVFCIFTHLPLFVVISLEDLAFILDKLTADIMKYHEEVPSQ